MKLKKLIVEHPMMELQAESIEDTITKEKQMYVVGPYMEAESVNRNKRKYCINEMTNEVQRYIKENISTGESGGELSHSEKAEIQPDRICHRVLSLKQEGNIFVGKSLILETPCGEIVKNLIKGGLRVGMSSKALGSLTPLEEGVNKVTGFKLIQVDLVTSPSCPKAYVQGILESKNWIIKHDGTIEEAYDIFEESLSNLPKNSISKENLMRESIINFLNSLKKNK